MERKFFKCNGEENYRFSINSFEYADLEKCAWFTYDNRIYFTDYTNKPKFCNEKWWSFVLRKLKISKTIRFGEPKELETIEPPPEPINFKEYKEGDFNYRIRFSGEKLNEKNDNETSA